MSFSHLFIGLPIALLVLFFELSSRFQSAAFIMLLFSAPVSISFFVSLVPASACSQQNCPFKVQADA